MSNQEAGGNNMYNLRVESLPVCNVLTRSLENVTLCLKEITFMNNYLK